MISPDDEGRSRYCFISTGHNVISGDIDGGLVISQESTGLK